MIGQSEVFAVPSKRQEKSVVSRIFRLQKNETVWILARQSNEQGYLQRRERHHCLQEDGEVFQFTWVDEIVSGRKDKRDARQGIRCEASLRLTEFFWTPASHLANVDRGIFSAADALAG